MVSLADGGRTAIAVRGRSVGLRHLLIVVLACALVVTTESIGFAATAPDQRLGIGYTMAHAFVGICYAVCAGITWRVSDQSSVAPRLMIVIALFWIPQPLYAAIGGYGWLWPPIVAIDLTWALFVGVLMLVYPSGRIVGRVDRTLILIAVVAAAVRAVAAILTDVSGPMTCACAPNVYAVFGNDAFYDVVDNVFRLTGALLLLVVVARVSFRWLRSSPPARSAAFAMPISLIAWACAIVYQTVAHATDTSIGEVVSYLSLVATCAVPISFVAGTVFIFNLRGRASDLVTLTGGTADRERWESILATTMRDPGLRVYWWDEDGGRYVDSRGAPVEPVAGSQSFRRGALLRVDARDGPLAVIDYDKALGENAGLLEAVSGALRLTVDNDRLGRELEQSLHEVRESRVRIIEAGIEARTRIERDLHDGSQQALVSLALSLRMASNRARADGADEVAEDIDHASAQLTGALKGLRELARGIHPTGLTVGGLSTALPELAMGCPIPVGLELEVTERLPPLIESTIYFLVAESLTNAVKYARADRVRVSVSIAGDELRVVVADDGVGGAKVGAGSGLTGLNDRIEAIGGHLEVESPDGGGTTVRATVPTDIGFD
jgi:signal transduction histidine kinase